jgi:putative transposase
VECGRDRTLHGEHAHRHVDRSVHPRLGLGFIAVKFYCTYIWTDEAWLYLAVVLDLYARRVIGWSISERMTATLVCDALTMPLWRRHLPKGVIVHSDRGSQYFSGAYQKLLDKHQLICSMSKKGDCYDNAAMESCNHSLKVEDIHGERFVTRQAAKQHDVYYNQSQTASF